MDNLSEKIAGFTQLVISDAGKKRDELLEQIDETKREKMRRLQEDIRSSADAEMKRKIDNIRKENNEKILRTETALKKRLLMKREGMVAEIMEGVREKLADFTNSSDYEPWLEEKISAAIGEVGEGSISVSVSAADAERYGERLRAAFKDVSFAEDSAKDSAGGVVVLNTDKNICVDYSFDTLLEDEESRFLQKSGLNIG